MGGIQCPFQPPQKGSRGSYGGHMGVKSQFSSNLDKTWYVGLLLDPNKVKFHDFVLGGHLISFLTPKRGHGGQTGVKCQFSSNLDNTWYVGLFLDPNNIKMPNFVWEGHLVVSFLAPLKGVKGFMRGSNLIFLLIWIKLGTQDFFGP